MSLDVGQQAPDFALPHQPGQDPVKLSDHRGRKVVILFFPLAFSPVCTDELCTVRDNLGQYDDLDADVLGISVDSPFALQAWAKAEGFEFPLLSDFNKEVSQDWGVLYEDLLGLQGVSKRAAFVVDREGVVRYAEVCPTPKDLPDLAAVRKTLADLS